MDRFGWKPYVPAAKRRASALRKLETLKKKGGSVSPVVIHGRTIASSFWGKSWCTNLESYSDYSNRLPRGRTYVRNGSVVDLQIRQGEVVAKVSGSHLYTVEAKIARVSDKHWTAICSDCAGSIGSLVELLQGKLSKSVMERVCRKSDGLFPAPREIHFSCSCPDWAGMCKHVAAVMYGIGARLDENPALLFTLRGVDENELIAKASKDASFAGTTPATERVLVDDDMSVLFGIDLGGETPEKPAPTKAKARKGIAKKAR